MSLSLGPDLTMRCKRTAASRSCSNRPASWPPSLSLGRWAAWNFVSRPAQPTGQFRCKT
jgi:hypothetical protein